MAGIWDQYEADRRRKREEEERQAEEERKREEEEAARKEAENRNHSARDGLSVWEQYAYDKLTGYQPGVPEADTGAEPTGEAPSSIIDRLEARGIQVDTTVRNGTGANQNQPSAHGTLAAAVKQNGKADSSTWTGITASKERAEDLKTRNELAEQGKEARRDETVRNQEWLDSLRSPEEIQAELDEAKKADSEAKRNRALAVAGGLGLGLLTKAGILEQTDPNNTVLKDLYNGRDETQAKVSALENELAEAQWAGYERLRENADFEAKSRYKSTANGKETKYNPLTDSYDPIGFDDPEYEYINGNKQAETILSNQKRNVQEGVGTYGPVAAVPKEYEYTQLSEMTGDEKSMYNYIHATEGPEAAHEYLEYLRSDLYRRQALKEKNAAADYAMEHPVQSAVESTVGTIGMSPFRGWGYLGQAAQYLTEGTVDANAPYNRLNYMTRTDREIVNRAVEDKWGKAGSFAYNTGVSMAEFVLNSFISGGRFVDPESAGGKLAEAVSLAIMGTGAAADATISAKERGLEDWQAFTLGSIAGAAEVVTEKVSIEALFRNPWEKTALAEWIKNVLYLGQNVASETTEEMGSDVINWTADFLIARDKSEWMQEIKRYMSEDHLSEKEAFRKAMKNRLSDLGLSGLGGGISGGFMAGSNVAYRQIAEGAQKYADRSANIEAARQARQAVENLQSGNDGPKIELRQNQDTDGQIVLPTGAESAEAEMGSESGEGDIIRFGTDPENRTLTPTVEEAETNEAVDKAMAEGNMIRATGIRYGASEELISRAERYSRMTGQEAEFYSHEAENGVAENGFVTPDGKIHINVKGKNPMEMTFGHEITHTWEGTDAYRELMDLAKKNTLESGGDWAADAARTARLYEAHGDTVTDEMVDQELTADWVGEKLFNDERAVREIYRDHPSLAFRIRNGLANFIARAAEAGGVMTDYEEQKLRNTLKVFDKYARMFGEDRERTPQETRGASQAGETVQAAVYPESAESRQEAGTPLVSEGGETPREAQLRSRPRRGGNQSADGLAVQENAQTAEAILPEGGDETPAEYMARMDALYEAGEISDEEYDEAMALAEEAESTGRGFESSTVERDEGPRGKLGEIADRIRGRYSLSPEEIEQRDEDYMRAVETGDTETEERIMREAADAAMPNSKVRTSDGKMKYVYHGTARADRVGNVFLPERATSGPMAYFTDSEQIAANYARDKTDTSLAYDEDHDGSYESQFRVQDGERSIRLVDAWNRLKMRDRLAIREAVKHVTWDEDMENIVYDENAQAGTGGLQDYRFREHRGNAIAALVDEWLNDGNLYGNEGDFMDAVRLAGIPEALERAGLGEAYYDDPNFRDEKVYRAFLNIQNPLVTTKIDESFADALEEWWDEQDQDAYAREYNRADEWDKNRWDVYEWIDRLRSDIENGTTHVWTSIPDAVTDFLKSEGYDGIEDQGGKFHDEGHTVYIPFESIQIKSADPVTYDDDGEPIKLSERFNDQDPDIRRSLSEAGAYDYSKSFAEQIEDYKDGRFPKGDTLIVRGTPKVFQDIGMLSLPMTYDRYHLADAIKNEDGAHLGKELLKKLPEALEHPIAIIDSETVAGRLVAIIDIPTQNGSTVAAVEIDGTGKVHGKEIDANRIRSVYTKKGLYENLMWKAMNTEANGWGGIYYWDKKRAVRSLLSRGVQFPKGYGRIPDGFVRSIHDPLSRVKSRIKSVTKTKQFGDFFGEWWKKGSRTSKVVDENGEPLIVYHQTGADIEEFDNSNPVAGANDSETPNGYFFKANDHDIGLDGKKQMAFYLNMRKPLHFQNRAEANAWYCEHVEGYKELQDEMKSVVGEIEARMDDIERQMFTMPDEEYESLDAEWNRIKEEELTPVENRYRGQLRELLNDYFLSGNSKYDGIILDDDGHRYVDGKREDVKTYIVFNKNQMKSATDNIGLYDKKNNKVRYSLSPAETAEIKNEEERIYTEGGTSTRFSLASDDASEKERRLDVNYISAVLDGDEAEERRILKDAAAQRGYTDEAYHGTDAFGFTRIDVSKSDDEMSFFVTADLDTAKTYTERGGVRGIGRKSDEAEKEFRKTIAESVDSLADVVAKVGGITKGMARDFFAGIEDSIINHRYKGPDGAVMMHQAIIHEIEEFFYDHIYEPKGRFTYDGDFVEENSDLAYDEWIDSDDFGKIYEKIGRLEDEAIKYDPNGGIYHVYVNPDGILEVQGNGAPWHHIPYTIGPVSGTGNTRQISQYAKDLGYKGVVFRNIVDDGGRGNNRSRAADVYNLFYPEEQVKSADLVTYDDDGKIILPSKRYDPRENDMRWSLSEDQGPIANLPSSKARNNAIQIEGGLAASMARIFGLNTNRTSNEFRQFRAEVVRPIIDAMIEGREDIDPDAIFSEHWNGDLLSGQQAREQFDDAITRAWRSVQQLNTFANRQRQETAAREARNAAIDARIPDSVEGRIQLGENLKQARRDRQRVLNRLLLTPDDMDLVRASAAGQISDAELAARSPFNYQDILDAAAVERAFREQDEAWGRYTRRLSERRIETADRLLEDANLWKDKGNGFAYARETAERNFRDVMGKDAAAMIDEYIRPVHKSEAESTRFKNRYIKRVKDLGLDQKVRRGNTSSEAAAVQFLGEAEDNVRYLQTMRNPEAVRDGQNLSEWISAIEQFRAENPNLDYDKVYRGIREFSQIYDELIKEMNRVLVENGYLPVNVRRGYFPHFNGGDDGIMAKFASLLGINIDTNALPTAINGLTSNFKPGKAWFGHAQERTGFRTDYDAVEGFDGYIGGVSDVIHQTANIRNLRTLANRIRYQFSDEGIKNRIDEIMADESRTVEEREAAIRDLTENGRFKNARLVNWLDEYTNLLANKKSKYDRGVEDLMGRRVYTWMKNIEGRVAANMIAGNLGSALTNFIPLNQAGAMLGDWSMLRGAWDTMIGRGRHDGFLQQSDFLTNRRGTDPLIQNRADKISEYLSAPMNLIDDFTSEVIVRAAYARNIRQGMDAESAMQAADEFAAGVMADRSKGATPTIFGSHNPLMKLFTQFQVEVNNEFSTIFKDIPKGVHIPDREKKNMVAVAAWTLLRYFVGAYLFNDLYEKFVGRRAALDPIDILNDAVGDLTGKKLNNVFDMISEGVIDEDKPKNPSDAITSFGTNALEEMPFVGGLLGGGRIPISSALPDAETIVKGLANENWSGAKKAQVIGREMGGSIGTYILPPFAGGAIKKGVQTAANTLAGGRYVKDKEGNDQLQYPYFTDTPLEAVGTIAKSALFGPTATAGGRDWVEGGFGNQSAKNTALYRELTGELGENQRASWELLQSLAQTDALGKRVAVAESGLSEEGKALAMERIMNSGNSNEGTKFRAAYDNGVSADAWAALYRAMSKYDLNGNNKYTQTEIREALDNMTVPLSPGEGAAQGLFGGSTEERHLTNSEKAALWSAYDPTWATKNNPYSPQIGERVVSRYEALKGAGE